MAEGSDTGPGGLVVPLLGDFEIRQRTIATDVMTITGVSGAAGDYIVCQDSSGTEAFVVGTAGITIAGTLTVDGGATITGALTQTGVATFAAKPVLNAAVATTAITTGMTTGEIFFVDPGTGGRDFTVAVNDGSFWRVLMTDN